jgi:hypothetical protein
MIYYYSAAQLPIVKTLNIHFQMSIKLEDNFIKKKKKRKKKKNNTLLLLESY